MRSAGPPLTWPPSSVTLSPDGYSFSMLSNLVVDLLGKKAVTCFVVCAAPDYIAELAGAKIRPELKRIRRLSEMRESALPGHPAPASLSL